MITKNPLRCSCCKNPIIRYVWHKKGTRDPLCGDCAAELEPEHKEEILKADNAC